jgi:NitT/TauT family transport system permease protein
MNVAEQARRRRRNRRIVVWFARALTLFLVLGGWELFTNLKIVDPFFFGQPSGVYDQLKKWIEHGTAYGSIWLQIWVTMQEALLGFLYGVAGGVVFGVLLGQVRFLSDVLGPYIKVVNALPRIVLGSIFLIWLGLGTTSKVALASVLVFFVVFFNAFQGVREVDRNFVANARVLGASRLQVVRHVVLPSALTWIIASLHVAFGFAIIGAIVGEILGAQRGLGLVITTSQNTFNPDGVFAAMLIIAVIALTAEGAIAQLEKRLLAWRPPSSTESAAI